MKVAIFAGTNLRHKYFANKIMSDGQIFAIEPDPVRFKRLEELCGQWEESSTNSITPMNIVLGETDGITDFFITNTNISGCSSQMDVEGIEWEKISIECKSLDTLVGHLEPGLIKVDVEGGEYKVLQGASEILKCGTCRFLMELHAWGDPSINKKEADVFNLFMKFGYDFSRIRQHWLFEKSNRPVRRLIRNRIINIIVRNEFVRNAAKACALKFPRFFGK